MALGGVIFDLGGTLIEYHNQRDWEYNSLRALRAYLLAHGYPAPDLDALLDIHARCIDDLHARLEHDPHATLLQADIFHALLDGIGLTPAHREGLRERYYAVALAEKRAVPEAEAVLRALQTRGLKLAAVSNTVWPGARLDVMLARLGLLPYLPVRLYSSDEAAWKPWPEIFRRALKALALPASEVIYVGDSFKYDVQGAQRAGLRAVRVEWPGREPVPGITPDAEIAALPDLIPLVDAWRETPISISSDKWRT